MEKSAKAPRPMLVAIVLLLLRVPELSAQTEQYGQLRGRIVDGQTSLPIRGATLEIPAYGLRQVADSSGRFAFTGIRFGSYTVRARRLGYQEAIVKLIVGSDTSTDQVIALKRLPAVLPEVIVAGRSVQVPPRLQEPYKRAAAGRGFFFTREDIEQLNPNDFQTLLNRIPTVSANDRGITFQRCQSGLGAARHEEDRPKVQIWIDGYRVSGRNPRETLTDVLAIVKPSSIQIMEVYVGVAQIPPEFLEDACAVIVIWTKRY